MGLRVWSTRLGGDRLSFGCASAPVSEYWCPCPCPCLSLYRHLRLGLRLVGHRRRRRTAGATDSSSSKARRCLPGRTTRWMATPWLGDARVTEGGPSLEPPGGTREPDPGLGCTRVPGTRSCGCPGFGLSESRVDRSRVGLGLPQICFSLRRDRLAQVLSLVSVAAVWLAFIISNLRFDRGAGLGGSGAASSGHFRPILGGPGGPGRNSKIYF